MESKQVRNRRILKQLFSEVINTGKLERAGEFITIDRHDHEPNIPEEMRKGLKGFQMAIGWFRSVSSNFIVSTEFMIAEGDMVMAYNRFAGTHDGHFMEHPPSHRKFDIQSFDVCRFNEDGLIAEHWGGYDLAGFLKQLQLMPS